MGRRDEALRYYRYCLRMNPQHMQARRKLGR
jgi:hypothetical protein